MTERKVVVRWTDCECEWATKTCDEYHTRVARIPLSKILDWIEEDAT